jgi:hypothetical protein
MTIKGYTVIENPVAYANATKARIIANAHKTWTKNTPDHAEIEAFLSQGVVEYRNGKKIFADNFVGSLASALHNYGKLSDKQCDAVRKSIIKREEKRQEWVKAVEEQKVHSAHIGVEAEKIVGRAYVEAVLVVDATQFSYYDSPRAFVFLMRDEQGNKIVYKSKSFLAFKFQYKKDAPDYWRDWYTDIKAGMTIDFTATIKAHTEVKGEKQTVVQRLKVTGLEYTEGKLKEAIDKTT